MSDAIASSVDISSTMMNMAPSALSMKIGPAASEAQIDASAQDFEAMFATQMLQPMFEGIQVDPMFGGGHGEEVMRSFMLQEYGKIIAKTGKLGIAAQVKAEMLRAQEGVRGRKSGNLPKTTQAAAANAYAAAQGGNQGGRNVAN